MCNDKKFMVYLFHGPWTLTFYLAILPPYKQPGASYSIVNSSERHATATFEDICA